MGKEHNYREFFFLTKPDNPKANKKAVCFSCIRKYTLSIAITRPDCFVSNKAKLCRAHLKKCSNFEQEYNEDERKEILSRHIPEDEKKPSQQKILRKFPKLMIIPLQLLKLQISIHHLILLQLPLNKRPFLIMYHALYQQKITNILKIWYCL